MGVICMSKKLYGENYFPPEDRLPEGDKNNYWESIYSLLICEDEYFKNKQAREVWQKSCEEGVLVNCFGIHNAVIAAVR